VKPARSSTAEVLVASAPTAMAPVAVVGAPALARSPPTLPLQALAARVETAARAPTATRAVRRTWSSVAVVSSAFAPRAAADGRGVRPLEDT